MKVIYIAGPFRGENAWKVEQNIRRAEMVAWEVANRGHAPLCPHTNTRFFDGTLTDEYWLECGLVLLERCDAMVLVEGWETSEGTAGEIKHAEKNSIPIYKSASEIPLG